VRVMSASATVGVGSGQVEALILQVFFE
jgi:hypothetical protein